MYGVTMTTTSVLLSWKFFDENSRPMIGSRPSPGICDTVSAVWLCSSPPIAKLCPLDSSTVVSTRRTVSPGTLTPPVVTLLFASTSLTSGRTFRLIRLSASTVGVKSSDTPNGLNSTVIAPVDEPACATGIGISPPARKLAVSPDIAVRFGSASIVIKPSWSSASSTTSIDQRPARNPPSTENAPVGDRLNRLVVGSNSVRPLNSPPTKLPAPPSELQLMPSCCVMLRLTSVTRTRRFTWIGRDSVSRLTIFSLSCRYGVSDCITASASAALGTLPDTISEPGAPDTDSFSCGKRLSSTPCSDAVSTCTITVLRRIGRWFAPSAISVVVPAFLPNTNTVRGDGTWMSAMAGSATNIAVAGSGSDSSSPLPVAIDSAAPASGARATCAAAPPDAMPQARPRKAIQRTMRTMRVPVKCRPPDGRPESSIRHCTVAPGGGAPACAATLAPPGTAGIAGHDGSPDGSGGRPGVPVPPPCDPSSTDDPR